MILDWSDIQAIENRRVEINRMLGIPFHTVDDSHATSLVAVARAASEQAPAVAVAGVRKAEAIVVPSGDRWASLHAHNAIANEAMRACMTRDPFPGYSGHLRALRMMAEADAGLIDAIESVKPVSVAQPQQAWNGLYDYKPGQFAQPCQPWNGRDYGMGVDQHPDGRREDDGA